MAVFLQLGGQGTAAGCLAGQVKHFGNLRPGGLGKARPVYGGVGLGLFRVQQFTVFDEQQAMGHQRRDRREARVQLLRVLELIERGSGAIGDRQAGLNFFGVGHEKAVEAVLEQLG
ncbi:hypothetical protein D3C80_1899630 [compost metagenome]